MSIACKDCQFLEDYAIGMSEVFPQWACHSPSNSVGHESWWGRWTSFKGLWFTKKPWWKNRKKNCNDFERKDL